MCTYLTFAVYRSTCDFPRTLQGSLPGPWGKLQVRTPEATCLTWTANPPLSAYLCTHAHLVARESPAMFGAEWLVFLASEF